MKITTLSQLNLLNRRPTVNELDSLLPNADICVLAGDIAPTSTFFHKELLGYLYCTNKYRDIIFVPGEIEFYGSNPQAALETLYSINLPHVHILVNQIIEIDGYRIAGAPLFYPANEFLTQKGGIQEWLKDFENIQGWSADWFNNQFYMQAKQMFARNYIDVWVTHHIPAKAITAQFGDGPWTLTSLGPLDMPMQQKKPQLVIYGHGARYFNRVYSSMVWNRPVTQAGEVPALYTLGEPIITDEDRQLSYETQYYAQFPGHAEEATYS